jgi:hypothetical protein
MFMLYHCGSQRFDDVGQIGIDAQLAGDGQRFLDDFGRRQFGVFLQRLGGGLGVDAARADRADAVFGFEHVAIAGDDQGRFAVGHQQHRFQAAQHAVGAPVLGQFDRGAQQVALVLFQLAFEAVEQGEGVGGAAGEAAQHLALVQLAHLARRALHDDIAQRDLAVAAERDLLPRRTHRMVVP